MAYHLIHGQDHCNFDLTATHRLPTLSAAAALDGLDTHPRRANLRSGLLDLDVALANVGPTALASQSSSQQLDGAGPGVQLGQITEVWGPPGTGKSTIGYQLAANALVDGREVVWVDCAHPLYFPRFSAILAASTAAAVTAAATTAAATTADTAANTDDAATPTTTPIANLADMDANLHHFACPTLTHFSALLCRPQGDKLPPDAALIVIDSLATLINTEFPKPSDLEKSKDPRGLNEDDETNVNSNSGNNGPEDGGSNKRAKKVPHPATVKRLQATQAIVTTLQKLTATRNCSVVLLTPSGTRFQAEAGAILQAAVNSSVWEQAMTTRLVLFRDWLQPPPQPRDNNNGKKKQPHRVPVRFVGIQKRTGKTDQSIDEVFAFSIADAGLVSHRLRGKYPPILMHLGGGRKRKRDEAGHEVSGSDDDDDEDYGWAGDDAEGLPRMPQQWQGSEDILIGQVADSDEGNGYDEEEDEDEDK